MTASTTPNTAQNAAGNDEKLDFKKIFPVFLVVLVDLLGLTIIIPLLPLYAVSFGADPGVIGLLGAAYPAMQFIGAPILGRLSDRYGRKPILVISQIGTLIGFLLLGFANNLILVFISRIIDGLSGANIATAQAIISDSTTEKTRTQGLGLLGAAFGLGFIIGPLIAFIALAVSQNNYQIPAFIAAAFSALSIVLTVTRLEETHKPDQQAASTKNKFSFGALFQALARPGIGILLVLMFAQHVAFGGFEQLLALFTLTSLGLDASGNAVIFVFVGVIIVLVQGYFIGKWSRRFGDRALIYSGLALLAVGLFLTAFTPSQAVPWYSKASVEKSLNSSEVSSSVTVDRHALALPEETNKSWAGIVWLLVAMIPTAIGGGILQPSINSLLTKRVADNERGGMLGISSSFLSAANVIAPIMGGALFLAGNKVPFLVWSAIMGVLFLAALSLIKPGQKRNPARSLASSQLGHRDRQ